MPRFRIAHLLGAAALLACEDGFLLICVNTGCHGGLHVRFSSVPVHPYHVEVRAADGRTAHSVYCADPARCDGAFFPDFTPQHAFVTIAVGGRKATHEVAPKYTTSVDPHRPSCGHGCAFATVSLSLP